MLNPIDLDYIQFLISDHDRLLKYRELVHFIANDYLELSYEKAQWQRDDWSKRCRKLIHQLESGDE